MTANKAARQSLADHVTSGQAACDAANASFLTGQSGGAPKPKAKAKTKKAGMFAILQS